MLAETEKWPDHSVVLSDLALLGAQQGVHYIILLAFDLVDLHRQRWSSGSYLILITMHLR